MLHTYSCLTTFPESSAGQWVIHLALLIWPSRAKCRRGAARSHTALLPKGNPPASEGASCLVWQGLTLTLKVMASITKMRSGKTLATSSTLLKYLTGSRTSRACSRSLNFPTKEEHRLLGQACLLVPASCYPHLSQPRWNSGGQKGRSAPAGGGRGWSAGSRAKGEHRHSIWNPTESLWVGEEVSSCLPREIRAQRGSRTLAHRAGLYPSISVVQEMQAPSFVPAPL